VREPSSGSHRPLTRGIYAPSGPTFSSRRSIMTVTVKVMYVEMGDKRIIKSIVKA
jgi:hypothetical protein